MINVEVTKNNNENNTAVLRRFTKRVQGAGILPRVRGIRYSSRLLSSYKTKMKTLKTLKKREEIAKLIKLGKMVEKKGR
jgi:ribosomal protein S21